MKNILNYFSLAIAGSYAAAEIAEAAGVRLPAVVNAENAVIAFVVVLVTATLLADYGRKVRPLPVVNHPVAVRVTPGLRVVGARRQVYAIRRGADAARLAKPAPANPFRKNTQMRLDRAA